MYIILYFIVLNFVFVSPEVDLLLMLHPFRIGCVCVSVSFRCVRAVGAGGGGALAGLHGAAYGRAMRGTHLRQVASL